MAIATVLAALVVGKALAGLDVHFVSRTVVLHWDSTGLQERHPMAICLRLYNQFSFIEVPPTCR